ncbi:MAG TPA: hypothetical protein DER01_09770, partial [Phycisphaerales bacterium]|nr:hypothetical protein [Phycisphaerales bacterium]
ETYDDSRTKDYPVPKGLNDLLPAQIFPCYSKDCNGKCIVREYPSITSSNVDVIYFAVACRKCGCIGPYRQSVKTAIEAHNDIATACAVGRGAMKNKPCSISKQLLRQQAREIEGGAA